MTDVGAYTQSESPYGTLDQSGNVFEWTETLVFDNIGRSWRGLRGGDWFGESGNLNAVHHVIDVLGESKHSGIRIASVIPEPTSYALVLAALCCAMIRRRCA